MMNEALTVLALGRPQLDTLVWTALFLLVGWLSGRLTRLQGPPAIIMGFLILMASSDLALSVSRSSHAPIWTLSPLTLLTAGSIILFARRFLPAPPPETRSSHFLYLPTILLLCWACWLMSILTPDPSSAYSFYQGWTPLYARAAQARGYFPMPADMALGQGYLSSGIYYALDVQGLGILGAVFLPLDDYAAFNGAVISGCMAALAVMAWSVRHNGPGLLVYLLLGLLFYRHGNFFRTVMGNNWGDVGLMAGGAAVAAMISSMPGRRRAALWAGFAATFLVFSRNFGAAYAAVILVGGFTFCRGRQFSSWLALGGILAIFSAKEILQVLEHGLFFPVASRMTGRTRDWAATATGTLHDWGIIPDQTVLGLPMGALWPALAVLSWLLWKRRRQWRLGSVLVVMAPILLLLAPFCVELVTGYRMSVNFSKLYIFALLLFPWYPAWLLSQATAYPLSSRLFLALCLSATAAAPLAWLVRRGPLSVIESYRANNTDLQMARTIQAMPGDMAGIVRDRPLVYFHHEPGLTLRYFIGGDLSSDFDFYSDPVAKAAQDKNFAETLASLGWPNLYFSYGVNAPHAQSTGYGHAVRLDQEIQAPDFSTSEWVGQTITFGPAVLVIPKANLP